MFKKTDSIPVCTVINDYPVQKNAKGEGSNHDAISFGG